MSQKPAAVLGAVLVLGIVAAQHWLRGPAVLGLSVGLVVSYVLWLRSYERIPGIRRTAGLYYGLAIIVQGFHFLEEYRTGFQRQFPQLLGSSWSDRSFIIFNVAALIVFCIAGLALLSWARVAFLFVWFMALVGGLANGALHVLAAIARGGYFPGLGTAIVHLVVGGLLLRELLLPGAHAAAS